MSFFKTLNIVARALKIEKYKMSDFFQGWGYDFICRWLAEQVFPLDAALAGPGGLRSKIYPIECECCHDLDLVSFHHSR